jgi:hypothetical protein
MSTYLHVLKNLKDWFWYITIVLRKYKKVNEPTREPPIPVIAKKKRKEKTLEEGPILVIGNPTLVATTSLQPIIAMPL